VLIPEDLNTAIQKAAQRQNRSKGDWVRRAIESALESQRTPGDPLEALRVLDAPTGDIDQMLAEIEAGRR